MLIQQLGGDRCLVGVHLDELPQRRHHLPSAALIDALIHDLDEVLFLLYSHATTMLPQAPRGGACALIEHPRASQPPVPKHTAHHKPRTTSRTATSSSIDVFSTPTKWNLRPGRDRIVNTQTTRSRSLHACEVTILLKKPVLLHITFLKPSTLSSSLGNTP